MLDDELEDLELEDELDEEDEDVFDLELEDELDDDDDDLELEDFELVAARPWSMFHWFRMSSKSTVNA